MEEVYHSPKMTPKQWIENFWYYHRWMFLTVLVFVLFIVIASVQYFTKSEPDVSVLYVGQIPLTQRQCEDIVASVEERIDDANGDGEVSVEIKTIVLAADFNKLNDREKIQQQESQKRYSDEILGGDCSILLLDEYFYEELVQSGVLINLYEVFPEGLPDAAFDYYGLRLKGTSLYQTDGFSTLPGNLILCLKYSSVYNPGSTEDKVDEDLLRIQQFHDLIEQK